ncbi:hypothetical protein Droror1_Dr00003666 [Drosera rotundifolia]
MVIKVPEQSKIRVIQQHTGVKQSRTAHGNFQQRVPPARRRRGGGGGGEFGGEVRDGGEAHGLGADVADERTELPVHAGYAGPVPRVVGEKGEDRESHVVGKFGKQHGGGEVVVVEDAVPLVFSRIVVLLVACLAFLYPNRLESGGIVSKTLDTTID